MKRFEKQTVVITGAASGIGKLCAQCLSQEGANLVLSDIDDERLAMVVNEMHELGNKPVGIVADVRDSRLAEKVCNDAVTVFGSLDLLICCAGGASSRIFDCGKEFHEYPIELLDWGIDVNLKGPLYFARAAMKHMVRQESGCIILLGSITGEEGTKFSVEYAAAKSALMNGVVKSLAQCGAPYNIRTCCISPGPVLTRENMSRMRTLLGRAAKPQEIVDMILFMASNKAAFVTGANIMIDGGRSSMMPEPINASLD